MPYLNTLMDDGSKILVLSEHWLWPYDLHRLNDINVGYNAIGKADGRLTEERDGGRGCGGIGLLWHKSIEATPISGISSDRICGIRMTMDDGDSSLMSVIGVYLPCLDLGVDCYREHLVELESVVSEARLLGPVTVLGDFNAHLEVGKQKLQGVLLQEVMDRCELSAVSMGAMASGPAYTFCGGEVTSTVDFVLMDVEAASMISPCTSYS